MKNNILFRYFGVLLLLCTVQSIAIAQTNCTVTPTSDQHTIVIQTTANLTLDGAALPTGSYIIAMHSNGGMLTCAGSIQWNGMNTAMTAFGDDGTGANNGYMAGDTLTYRIETPNGCIIDNVTATYQTGGIFTSQDLFSVNGISGLASLTAISPNVSTTETTTNVTCFGANDGNITLTASGGTTYQYAWSTGDTTASISNLAVGTYSYTVTDVAPNSCVLPTTNTITITEPTLIISTVTSTPALCAGSSDGTASISSIGGVAPYTYTWGTTPTQAGPTVTNLSVGLYPVTITDATGCTMVDSITVTEPPVMTASSSTVDVSCPSGNDGSIDLSVAGGVSGYAYSWSNNAVTEDINNLTAGTYSCTITDQNACQIIVSNIMISEPNAFVLSDTTIVDENMGAGDGSIDITFSGGTAPYSFAWSNASSAEDPTNLSAGTYSCTITDANNCQFVVGPFDVQNFTSTSTIEALKSLSLSPNPTTGNLNIQLELEQNADVQLSVFSMTGKELIALSQENLQTKNYQLDLSNYPNGMYLIKLNINNQFLTEKVVLMR